MKYLITLFFALCLFGCSSKTQEQYIPDTVDDAVNYIISQLKEEDIEYIIAKSSNEMNDFSLAWNANILQSFNLRDKNSKLLNNCGSQLDAFNCSEIIIYEVWKKLRNIRPQNEIKGIDNTVAMLKSIVIAPYYRKNEGMINFINYINNEIQNSEYKNKLSIIAKCESHHYRLKNFFNENKQTVKDVLKYIDFQELATINIRPGVVYLTPKPFLNSEPCRA